MKKVILLLLFALSLNAFSQQSNADSIKPLKVPLTGFWGLKFGMTKQQVVAALTGKVQSKELIIKPDQNILLFRDVRFGGNIFDKVYLRFFNGRLYIGYFIKEYSISNRDDIKSLYESICDSYIEKYGVSSEYFDDKISGMSKWKDINNKTEVEAFYNNDYSKDDYNVVVMYVDITVQKKIKEEENKEL